MKRRNFLKAASVLTLPVVIKGFPVEAMTQTPLLNLLGQQALNSGRVLVLVQLNGGNDGLNTVLSLDRYADLSNARSNILIPQYKALSLNNINDAAIHPAMPEIRSMINDGLANVVQGVSYPNPSFSHFRATDIWLTGASSDQYLTTGWLGRTIDKQYPGYPNSEPAYPLAVQIGSQASTVTQTSQTNAAFTITDPSNFYRLITPPAPTTDTTPYAIELDFLRSIQLSTNQYADVIINANSKGTNMTTYPDKSLLGDQLKIVARLIKGGLQTPIYIVTHPETFDTHSNQVDSSDHTTGAHAYALSALSQAISAFQTDLGLMGLQDRVVGMTFTEFGRRIASNSSAGTDHGTAVPMFFFGAKLNRGVVGGSPAVTDGNGNLLDNMPMQYDFRQVYYTVLKDWFQLTDADLNGVLPIYSSLPIFNQAALPVTIQSFTGNWQNNKVSLQWTTDNEVSIDAYEVQRSEDGNSYSKIGLVSSLNVNTSHVYSFTDNNLHASYYYYRIKVIEKDGTTKFSTVLLLRNSQVVQGVRVKIMPNPIDNWFAATFQDKISGVITARILDLSGKEVWKAEQHANETYNLTFTINKSITPGAYIIQLKDSTEHEVSTKVLVK